MEEKSKKSSNSPKPVVATTVNNPLGESLGYEVRANAVSKNIPKPKKE